MLAHPYLLLSADEYLRILMPLLGNSSNPKTVRPIIISVELGKCIYEGLTREQDGSTPIMKSAWLVGIGIMMLLQQAHVPEPLSLEHQGQPILTANRADYSLPGQTMIDMDKLDRLIDNADRRTYQPPVNAKIGDNGKIVPEKPGYRLNRESFKEQFYTYFYGKGSSRIEAERIAIYPKVDSELLANIRQKPIGQYVTYYNTGNKNRSHNLALASKTINNHVVFPGEVFSFNLVVGRRTEDRGYLRAPIIVRGELSEGIGGGICQVSSTLFNATDRAGLQIIQRYSHSRDVPYVLPGRDATVSWGRLQAAHSAGHLEAFAGRDID
ncbi:MAG: hypothetical protein K0R28_5588 [Paenibacillus sp.]|nr:hypothetical protein [Paenibacillus sp.]